MKNTDLIPLNLGNIYFTNQNSVIILFSFFIMIFNPLLSKSNAKGVYKEQSYTIENISPNTTIDLHLYNSGHFYIEISQELTDDMFDIGLLSYGDYEINGKLIYLNDKVNSFSLVYQINLDKLKPIKTFLFMNEKDFIKLEFISKKEESLIENINKNHTKRNLLEIRKKNEKKPSKFILKAGQYSRNNNYAYFEGNKGYNIELGDNKEYEFHLNNLVLSKGTWKQSGNCVVLFDKSLESNFYLIIKDEKCLISNQLPASFDMFNYCQIIK